MAISRSTAAIWRARFAEHRLDGLLDEPRPGRPRTITDEQVEEVIVKTLETTPKDATHWSTRSMAREAGLTQSAVLRIWKAFGLQPHRQETWKLSKDPQFIAKVRDVVGLYLNPPERAVVLCVDEKSQIQALDRTAPILPMLPGVPERATHDYKRAGTSSLYAALDLTTGKVIGRLHGRHRAIEFKQFLRTLDREVPTDLDVHVVLDNSSTHKTPAIQRWLAAHPRFVLHFTPTSSSSWLNLVERWFAELTTKKLRRGAHRSVRALNDDIRAWIDTWNDDPRPFVWSSRKGRAGRHQSRHRKGARMTPADLTAARAARAPCGAWAASCAWPSWGACCASPRPIPANRSATHEAGVTRIPGSVAVAVQMMLSGAMPPDGLDAIRPPQAVGVEGYEEGAASVGASGWTN